MSETQARIGYGFVLLLALASEPQTKFLIAETKTATPPSETDDQQEATHSQSPNGYREFVPGLTDGGEASFEMNYIPGSVTDRFLLSLRGKRLVAYLVWPNGVQCIFSCSRSGYEKDASVEDVSSATLTLKVSGEPTMTDATAPENIVAPTIKGVAKVGVPLEAVQGVWAGASDITYQWKADDTVVAGATSSSFVPKVANVGDVITVEVTAKNDDFTVTETSVGTSAVVA